MPSLTRQEAGASHQRHAPRGSVCIGEDRRLRLAEPDGQPYGPEPLRIALQWGRETVILRCPATLADTFLHELEGNLGPALSLPPELAGLLLEAAAINPLMMAERTFGLAVSVLDVKPDDGAAAEGFPLLLQSGGTSARLHLECTSAQADRILAAWPVDPRPVDRVAVPAALRLGRTELTCNLVASLRRGDTVLLQHHQPMLVVADAWEASVRQRDGRFLLEGSLHPVQEQNGGRMAATNPGEPAGLANPDDLPVTLTFEVGRLNLTVGELRRLGPGAVLNLGRSQANLVEIATAGHRIGQGELVDIEGTVGIRITRLFDAG